MNDDPAFDEPAFDDPAFDELRALLAETRATGPVPDDVAARLDTTLASLQAERVAEREGEREAEAAPGTAVVVPLRRRLAPRLLVAAAAMVVIATGSVGIARVVSDTGGDDAMTADSATSADADTEGAPEPSTPRSGDPAQELDSGGTAYADGPVELSSATFARDAARVMLAAATASKAESPTADGLDTGGVPGSEPLADGAVPTAPPLTATTGRLDTLLRQALVACPGPGAPGAVILPATLDDAPVALVFRPPTQAGQLVEAWSCDGARLVESATVAR